MIANTEHHIPNGIASPLVASQPNSLNIPLPASTTKTCVPTNDTHRKTSASEKGALSNETARPRAGSLRICPATSGAIGLRLGRNSRTNRGDIRTWTSGSDAKVTSGQESVATMYARIIIKSPFTRICTDNPRHLHDTCACVFGVESLGWIICRAISSS